MKLRGWTMVMAAALVVGVAAMIIEATSEPWQTGLTAAAGVAIMWMIMEYRNGR